MKFNWGTGIVIGILLFMGFILQYVIRVQIDPKFDNELVTEDYYQAETKIDNDNSKRKNALNLSENLQIINSNEGIIIEFPKDFDFSKISGEISLYRPSNKKLDQKIPLSLTSNAMIIPEGALEKGRWDISVDWNYDGISYLNAESLNLN